MTKSRKQKQKKQDFLKQKLKVGKTKPKASNLTDTSFVSRTISIRNQHLEHDNDLSKKLTLLKHHNSTVRKETLGLFQKSLPKIINSKLISPLVTQSIPLICDDSRDVREGLISLIKEIGKLEPQVLRLHCKVFVLYINMAMTHIITQIQNDSTKFLQCLLEDCQEEIIRQAWVKMMNGLFCVLGWGAIGNNISAGVAQSKKRNAPTLKIHLDTLYELIKSGCLEIEDNTEEEAQLEGDDRNSHHITRNQHLIPDYPQPYDYLKLFARELKNKDATDSLLQSGNLAAQDVDTRQRIFEEQYLKTLEKELDLLVKDGGVCGRSANNIKQLLTTISA
ncbi:Ipi1p NDAI_0C04490 [Naumovozyma dairenensis CBS 421]|uniref:Pre-rRNA-processing protein n=1 Tax=Naumovozyma dairenensis (strain ATCC 10597 / BCRC 20456 / CBS 421 / NBRC 0211 / NRRL Y-12639) TaxID=1071378 RepID=G0W8J8_NAUDC|nr:hypothetical protein NDAI_0C04490 [Naumovozyma dairenensis CBS 421]CCD24109.1 hypothetical protein NDAI_0C04490 [Naumovozyma dairenensis CBS 421]